MRLKNILAKARDSFVIYKIHYDRGRSWWGTVMAPIGIITMFGVFRDSRYLSWFFKYPVLSTVCLFVFVVIGFGIVGYFDRRYIRSKEIKENQKYNKEMVELFRKVDEIYKKI